MKRIKKAFLIVMLCMGTSVFAQSNQFNYQAALRDASGAILSNQNVALSLEIRSTSLTGSAVYSEIHNTSTNEQGLVNLSIGSGTVITGNFASIDWGAEDYFMNVTVNGTDMGTSPILSVPVASFAFNAENAQTAQTAANVFSGDYNDLSNKPSTACCGFRASVTSTQQVIPANSSTVVSYSSEIFDDGGNYDPVNSVYTAPSDGLYHFDCNIGLGNSEYKYLYIRVNSTNVTAMAETRDGYYGHSIDLKLNAGDEVRVVAYVFNSPSTIIWNAVGNHFSGHKVY